MHQLAFSARELATGLDDYCRTTLAVDRAAPAPPGNYLVR